MIIFCQGMACRRPKTGTNIAPTARREFEFQTFTVAIAHFLTGILAGDSAPSTAQRTQSIFALVLEDADECVDN
jgi:hypothetical protein